MSSHPDTDFVVKAADADTARTVITAYLPDITVEPNDANPNTVTFREPSARAATTEAISAELEAAGVAYDRYDLEGEKDNTRTAYRPGSPAHTITLTATYDDCITVEQIAALSAASVTAADLAELIVGWFPEAL